ncbi:dipeptidyl aminopeptidase/acylaminoacyl peptidase/CubicO group peptidase (beta-lactamase class C family) [Microbacterium resistens]|uniref:Dipeptidyl aminopeptidase/acylaminoacyl peptidase/CubicO group peptidase (Beta-lactamase class C family) n=1 Tax=Microbacterium resistens TaxID=156977 RepID=A0ABU1S7W0_9MICO|nr:serine hydrolase [Microbacterium resistens]MDR6865707.1 dipeptidyl aminopeptidase/acylaminoacyl peptidase/CubicO group peptidase (beta-lactamase class C family) [Microbacterium resistens]
MARPTIDDFLAIASPENPALSPDGSQVIYVLRTVDRDADRDVRSLWSVRTDGGEPRRLTRGIADSAPVWSPDGSSIAFLRADDGPPQLWVLPADGGEARRLTSLVLGAGTAHWSPDGTRIAFSAAVDTAAAPGEDAATTTARRGAPAVADALGYKFDGAGIFGTLRAQIHVVDVATETVTVLTEDDRHASEPFWSPDGALLAYSAAAEPDADLTLSAAVFTIDPSRPLHRPTLVSATDVQTGVVGWTADGTAIEAAGRLDTGIGVASLLLFPLDGGSPVDVTAGMDRNLMTGGPGYPGGMPQHGPDGGYVVCVRENGYTHVRTVAADGGGVREIVAGTDSVAGLSVVGDHAAIVVSSPTAFGEIALVDLADGAVRTLTAHAPTDLPLIVAEERRFTISDGSVVTGWLRRDAVAQGPLPLLLDIHGGPHNSWNGAADLTHPYHQLLARQGWAILTVNPRGSDGYGEAFFRGVVGDWGLADAKDFLEPIDQLVAEGLADPARLAVTGYSYGGYMACYLTSRDDRFAAAVPGGVVTDLISMGGTSDAAHYITAAENGGLPWSDRERLLERSPYTHVDRVTTPTLILHGAADDRCPVGQAEQWFTALRERGVPARLVLYPGGTHLFPLIGPPSHRADFSTRIIDWVCRHAPAAGTKGRARIDAARWQRRLSTLATAHGVPGASLGILRLGEDPSYAHHGVLNVRTGVETTADSLFQIGSITKVWTATAAMRLVDEGRLALDTPVVEYLPGFRGPTEEITTGVTLRHLLSHTSGIDGDFVVDTGRGDDCLEEFVARFPEAPQNHPLGATMSYCNAGFSLIGRLIETVTGTTWDQAMKDLLYTPLGLPRTATLPEEVLLHRAASGHPEADENGPVLAKHWTLPRSMGPAGLINAPAADVLAFARMHLEGGVAADGTRILAEDTVARMRETQIEMPDPYTLGTAWGLGWILFDWDGRRLIGHDGNTIGQSAFLRILPDEGLAVTLLTNGPGARALYQELFTEIFAELADLRVPGPFAIPDEPYAADFSRHLGTYERAGVRSEVFEEGGGLRLRTTLTGPLADMLPETVQEHDLVPVRENEFAVPTPGSDLTMPVVFYSLPAGEQYVHMGVRAAPKVS